MQAKTAILGFGNPVRADDGIGIYVIEALQKQLAHRTDLSIFDMGTSAFEVLFKLRDHEKLILIDAVVRAEEPVGTVFNLPASEVESEIEEDPLVFLHGLKWSQALSYAKKILGDAYPKEIDVFLIAVEDTRFNVGMTEAAKKGGDLVVETLLQRLHADTTL